MKFCRARCVREQPWMCALRPARALPLPTYCWKAPHQQHLPCIHPAIGVLLGTYHTISLAHFVG